MPSRTDPQATLSGLSSQSGLSTSSRSCLTAILRAGTRWPEDEMENVYFISLQVIMLDHNIPSAIFA